ncbi:phytase [Phenylobacterium sp.]|uniref:phytase n=1 Tax=Phenylobacterium sp. TaxID=1871053 RepID=UPI002FC6D29B
MNRLRTQLLATAAAFLAMTAANPVMAQAAAAAVITPTGQTQPTAQAEANAAAFVLNPEDAASGHIVGTASLAGLEVYRLDGTRVGVIEAGEVVGVDVRHDITLAGRPATVLGALDERNGLRFFDFDGRTGKAVEITAKPMPIEFAAESMCLYRDARDANLYAFVVGSDGEVEQWTVFADATGKLDARPARRLHVASEASYCVADDATGDLYIAEQGVGIWRFAAGVESIVEPQLIDAARLGHIAGETGGLALQDGGPGARYLIASNASANSFNVYDRGKDHQFAGTFSLAGVEAAGGLATGAAGPQGLLIAMDDENEGGQNYKLAAWPAIAQALGLAPGTPQDPRGPIAPPVPVVRPVVETTPVPHGGDAADDPAIWVDPVDPARSLIIGTDKQAGLYAYDLDGKVVQFLPDGKMNNVDLRDGFKLGGRIVSLVAASNRTDDTIALYAVDPATRKLVPVSDGPQATGLTDPYGLCMYRSRRSGKTYVFINDTDGRMRQWELMAKPNGKVAAKAVRDFKFDTQAEGCVADDETGALYVAEEDIALWKMGAEPRTGAARTVIATVADNPALKDDLEGVGLYDLGGGRGYLVLSSQGDDTYAVFAREGSNRYIGSFAVVGDGARGIDGSSETDGLEVTSRPLGPRFPTGAFIAQDGRNVAPAEAQNFKLVPWDAVAAALKLEAR